MWGHVTNTLLVRRYCNYWLVKRGGEIIAEDTNNSTSSLNSGGREVIFTLQGVLVADISIFYIKVNFISV